MTGSEREAAAFNLQQTLLLTTTLIFTGLAVAFAFRCGLFNIGGQGQWTMGVIVSVWVGSSWADLAGPAHIAIAIVLAALAGAAWAGIAGFLKATVGAHEVITTIMLNWIAYWVGSYLFGFGGPLQTPRARCRSRTTWSSRRGSPCSGATRSSRASTSASSSPSAPLWPTG